MTTHTFFRVAVLVAVVCFFTAPLSAMAAEPPACLLGVLTQQAGTAFTNGTAQVAPGGWVYILWVSTEGVVATGPDGMITTRSGFTKLLPQKTATYYYRFNVGVSAAICSVTIVVGTPPQTVVEGATTVRVASVPLLTGGDVYAGTSIPVSYLQVANVGTQPASVSGFWIKQNGSASTESVVGLSTIDDTGLLQNSVGPIYGNSPFSNGVAFVPTTDTVLAPGQRHLFTIKASMANTISSYTGTQLNIAVTAIKTSALIQGVFPIPGTVWTLR